MMQAGMTAFPGAGAAATDCGGCRWAVWPGK